MKYASAIILTFLILAGCSKKQEKTPVKVANQNQYNVDTSDIKATPIDAKNETFSLEYKFPKGKTYHYRLTTITHDIQTIKSDTTLQSNVTQEIIYLMDLTPVSVDKDGVIEFNLLFNSVKLHANANGKEYNFESSTATDSAEINKYAEYKALTGSDMGVRVTKKGEILEIFRTDKIVNNFLTIKGFQDSVNASQREQLRENMIQGAIKPLLYQVFRQTVDHPMMVDSSWTIKQPASHLMVFEIKSTNTYKITSLQKLGDDKLAVIEGGIKSEFSGKNKVSQQGVDYTFRKPVTSAGGKIYFNLNDGCIQKAKTFTQVNLSFDMKAKTPQGTRKGTREEMIRNNYILERL